MSTEEDSETNIMRSNFLYQFEKHISFELFFNSSLTLLVGFVSLDDYLTMCVSIIIGYLLNKIT